jgi:Heavy metal binding domain
MKTFAAGALLAVIVAAGASVQTPAVSATFHHFHFRVGDPAAAMNHGAAALNGTRVLLRGLGVGVRVNGVHALFDRLDASEPAAAREAPDAAYSAAVMWLRSSGIELKDDAKSAAVRAAIAETFRGELLDHVSFTASDLPSALAVLRSHGALPLRESSDAALFKAAAGVRVEVVRDLDAPDAYWCPMHPDVRSSAPGTCPICRMALVPIPASAIGEYRMDLAVSAAKGGGIASLRITLREPDTDRRVASLATVHERLLHLFIIDRSLQFFRHVHPDQIGDGTFELRESIPPGAYVVIADFLPQGGATQMVQRAVVTPGYTGALFPASPDLSSDTAKDRIVDGMRVQLESHDVKAGREAVLRFTLSDAASGAPVTDLEPFLGAPGHMLIVNADLTEADHVHPEGPTVRGPAITFRPLLPAGGFYKLWLQFQRKGVVTTVPFVVSAEER